MRIWATAFVVLVVGAACAGGDDAGEGSGTRLEVTRADGTTIELPDRVRAWCGPQVGGDPQDEEEELQVLGGDLPEEDDPRPFWIFSRKTELVEKTPRVELPETGAGHASFFVLDAEERNELSSSEERASGTIEVVEWGCERGDEVRIEIDAVLDSELGGLPTATAEGEIETVIGDPVAPPD